MYNCTLQTLLHCQHYFNSRRYRKYQNTKENTDDLTQPSETIKENDNDGDSSENDEDTKRRQEYRKPWRESTVAAPVIDTDVKIGEDFFT